MPKLSLKEQGNQFYKKGEYSMASGLYKKYITQPHDDNKNAYYNLGQCYFQMKKFQKAIDCYNDALKIDPSYIKCYYRKALAYYELNDMSGTYTSVKKYCNSAPRDNEWEKMKQLGDTSLKRMSIPQPDKITDDETFFLPKKKEEEELVEEKKRRDLGVVQELVRMKKKRQAINVLYELMLGSKNKDFHRQKIKQIKQLSQEDMVSYGKKYDEENLDLAPYEKYFLYPVQRKKDIFEAFFSVLEKIIQNSQIQTPELEELLWEIHNKYEMFGTCQMTLSENEKATLRTGFQGRNISQIITSKYCDQKK